MVEKQDLPSENDPNFQKPPKPLGKKLLRGFAWVMTSLVVLIFVLLTALMIFGNTQKGQNMLAKMIGNLTDHSLAIEGLSGYFPNHFHIQHLKLLDHNKIWLEANDVQLDYKFWSLLKRNLIVEQLLGKELKIYYFPDSDDPTTAASTEDSESSHFKLGLNINHLKIDRLFISQTISVQPLELYAEGMAKTSDLLKLIDFQSIKNLPDTALDLKFHELNHATDLKLQAQIAKSMFDSHIQLQTNKEKSGILSRLLQSDQLDPVQLNFIAKGPLNAVQTNLNMTAAQNDKEPIKLDVHGQIDLIASSMNLVMQGHSPAMTFNRQIGWSDWKLDANLYGKFQSPAGNGLFEINNLVAKEWMLNHLAMHFSGANHPENEKDQKYFEPWAKVKMIADGIRIPGAKPNLFANSPIILEAIYHPNEPNEPLDIHLNHSLIMALGRINLKKPISGVMDIALPKLEPLAAIEAIPLQGWTALNLAFAMSADQSGSIKIDADGPVVITGGMQSLYQTIGEHGHIALHSLVKTASNLEIMLREFAIHGKAIDLLAQGEMNKKIQASLNLELKDLQSLSPVLRGKTSLQTTLSGGPQDINAQLKAITKISVVQKGSVTMRPSQLQLTANAEHLLSTPNADVVIKGDIDKAPIDVQLQAKLENDKKTYSLLLKKMLWRSLSAQGEVVLPPQAVMPVGNFQLHIARLADLRPFTKQALDGFLKLDMKTMQQTKPRVVVKLDGSMNMNPIRIGKLSLNGFVDDPINRPDANLKLQIDRLQVPQAQGNILVSLQGKQEALNIAAQARMGQLLQSPGNLDTALTLDMTHKQLQLKRLTALIKGETIRLMAPTKLNWGEKLAFDQLRLSINYPGSQAALIDLNGTIKPKLNVTATLNNITPGLATPFIPDLKAKGVVNAQARLTGSLEKPTGNVRLVAQNMKMLTGPGVSLPAADLTAIVHLLENKAQIDANLHAGKVVHVAVSGAAPLQPNGPLGLHVNGNIGLSGANAILGSYGQQILGNLDFAFQLNGTPNAPMMQGGAYLTQGSFQDYGQGIRLHNMDATLLAQHDQLVLQSFNAIAGEGNVHMDGNIGIFRPGLPVDLHLTMKNARPLSSDLLTAILNSDIFIKGMAQSRIDVTGGVKIKRADINIPHSISRSVVTIKVVRPGEKETVKSVKERKGPVIGLNLMLESAGNIIVQGFGLFTNMSGSLHIGGTAQEPQMQGGFKMENGHINFAGVSLNFNKGNIGFQGSGVTRQIDPILDFESIREVEGNTAKLQITGTASNPKIKLSSTPPLPQDRILAILLFGTDTQNLSASQMAEIGVAVASLGGNGVGFDPIGTVRKALHLDRLSIGGGNGGNGDSNKGTSVEAGKYVARGIYLGAKQSTGEGGTQAEMQIDITKHLKGTATVGTGKDKTGFVTPDNDPGSSIGLLYQFNY